MLYTEDTSYEGFEVKWMELALAQLITAQYLIKQGKYFVQSDV